MIAEPEFVKWFIDDSCAAWNILPDPRIYELAAMFFELMVCGWSGVSYCVLSKLAVGDEI